MASQFDLYPGARRRVLFLLPLPLVLAALYSAPVLLVWQLLLTPLVLLMALAEWRRQLLPRRLYFSADSFVLESDPDDCWQPELPLHYFQAPGYLALRCRAGRRVRWLAVFADEIDSAAFARLNRLARNGR